MAMSPSARPEANLSISASFWAESAAALISVSALSTSDPAGIGTNLPICCPFEGVAAQNKRRKAPTSQVVRLMVTSNLPLGIPTNIWPPCVPQNEYGDWVHFSAAVHLRQMNSGRTQQPTR